jgi:tRNA-binding EMAP/Myf-like protein
MKEQQLVMGIKPFQKVLYPEVFTADVLKFRFVVLMDGFHDKAHKIGRFTAQIGEVNRQFVSGLVNFVTRVQEVRWKMICTIFVNVTSIAHGGIILLNVRYHVK